MQCKRAAKDNRPWNGWEFVLLFILWVLIRDCGGQAGTEENLQLGDVFGLVAKVEDARDERYPSGEVGMVGIVVACIVRRHFKLFRRLTYLNV